MVIMPFSSPSSTTGIPLCPYLNNIFFVPSIEVEVLTVLTGEDIISFATIPTLTFFSNILVSFFSNSSRDKKSFITAEAA